MAYYKMPADDFRDWLDKRIVEAARVGHELVHRDPYPELGSEDYDKMTEAIHREEVYQEIRQQLFGEALKV